MLLCAIAGVSPTVWPFVKHINPKRAFVFTLCLEKVSRDLSETKINFGFSHIIQSRMGIQSVQPG